MNVYHSNQPPPYFSYVGVLPAGMYVHLAHAVPEEARRGRPFPIVVDLNLASGRAVAALNH